MKSEQESNIAVRILHNRNAMIGVIVAVVAIVVVCVLLATHSWSANSQTNSVSSANRSGNTAEPYWEAPIEAASTEGLVTTYAVKDGSAGPDFLGVSNTNFDFTEGDVDSDQPVTGYDAAYLYDVTGAGLAIWATSVNENPNPYYVNLFYNTIMGNVQTTQTTWLRS